MSTSGDIEITKKPNAFSSKLLCNEDAFQGLQKMQTFNIIKLSDLCFNGPALKVAFTPPPPLLAASHFDHIVAHTCCFIK